MWNYNLKQGSVWTIKSLNNYDEHYEGMTFGETTVIILSVYTDVNNLEKFTYLKLDRIIKNNFYAYEEIIIKGIKYYINFNSIMTGDKKALESYISTLDNTTIKNILNTIKVHYSFFNKIKNKLDNEITQINKNETKSTIKNINLLQEELNTKQVNNEINVKDNVVIINKYGIQVRLKESEHIQVKNNRFKFSEQFKTDVVNIDPEQVSIKYQIFPVQAVKIIKSKLIYVNNHK